MLLEGDTLNNNLINIQNTRRLLLSLVVLDVLLSLTGYLWPDFWFRVFHGTEYMDPQGFLRRCAGNWAMFAVLQAIALARWEKDTVWLGIVAGVRFSDLLTDWSYLWFCSDVTLPGRVLLFSAGPLNLACGLYFYLAFRKFSAMKYKD